MATPSVSIKPARNHRTEPLIWPPLNIGQLGTAGKASHKTFASFEMALQEGAEGIALEVQLSSDGVPVVIGDAQLSRATSGRGWVQEQTAKTLIELAAGSPSNRRFPFRASRQHARIFLLSEILQWVRGQKCMAFIAIKNRKPGAEAKVLKVIERAKVRHLTRVIACNLPGLRRLRQLDAKVHLGLCFSGRPPAIRHASTLGAEVVLPLRKAPSHSFIRRAHRASMLVIPWAVDSPRQIRRAILEGVDGIVTNYPAKLTETLARLQKTRRGRAS